MNKITDTPYNLEVIPSNHDDALVTNIVNAMSTELIKLENTSPEKRSLIDEINIVAVGVTIRIKK